MIEKIEAWAKTKTGQVITSGLSVGILIYLGLRAFYTRINATGWEDFPAVMLDYFAIVGGVTLLILAVVGIYGIVKELRDQGDEEVVQSS